MKREWQPGDVAVVTLTDGANCPAVRSEDGTRWVLEPRSLPSRKVVDARPLVVIDPEDREQVERLLADFCRAVDASDIPAHPQGWSVNATQAALREFANPKPKPDEPQGLGAVVEDDKGGRWTQVGVGCWIGRGRGLDGYGWGEFNAVRVLSEGVTQ